MSDLKPEFDYYRDHQQEFAEKYCGQVIVIKQASVLGVYPDEVTAINETKRDHKLGTFLVQRVVPGDSETVQTYHSRVAFR